MGVVGQNADFVEEVRALLYGRQNMTKLLTLSFPTQDFPESTEMYFKGSNVHLDYESSAAPRLCFKRDSSASFDTYFSSFSCIQYLRYTVVQSITLQLELAGTFQVTVFALDRNGITTPLAVDNVNFASPAFWSKSFCFDELAEKNIVLFFTLHCQSTQGQLLGGHYCTSTLPHHPTSVALNICTYHRESYVIKNLSRLVHLVKELQNNLEIFIIDNGRTLTNAFPWDHQIHYFPNKNTGGSGGFTRGLLEITKANRFSHVIMMDDDVIIEPSAIFRLILFLQFIKPEYQNLHVAGGMFARETPWFQHEAGAQWEDHVDILHSLDFRETSSLTLNGIDDIKIQYGGWWFLCFPTYVMKENGYPLPLFVRADDIEYGLRNITQCAVLNGVGIWHEGFDQKYSPHLEYFTVRNHLVLSALLNRPAVVADNFVRSTLTHLVLQDYEAAEFSMNGICDFLAGPDFFLQQDEERILQMCLSHNPVWKTFDELEKEGFSVKTTQPLFVTTNNQASFSRLLFKLSLYGWLLPAKGCYFIDQTAPLHLQQHRSKFVLHLNPHTKTGYVSKKSFPRFLADLARLLVLYLRLHCSFTKIAAIYRSRKQELISESFWNKHLGLE